MEGEHPTKWQRSIRTIITNDLFLLLSQETSGDEDEQLNRCDAFAMMMGGQNEEVAYSKTASLHVSTFVGEEAMKGRHSLLRRSSCHSQIWLLGYEFPSTLIVITKTGITIVTSSGKGVC